MNTKVCSKCGLAKEISCFYKDKSKKDGHHVYCKKCKDSYILKYVKTDKGRKYKKRYRRENKDKIRIWQTKYKRSGKYKNWISKYRKTKKYLKAMREKAKVYREKYPEKVLAHSIARRYKDKLKEKSCENCAAMENLEMHHTDYSKPKVVITLCRSCHLITDWRKITGLQRPLDAG